MTPISLFRRRRLASAFIASLLVLTGPLAACNGSEGTPKPAASAAPVALTNCGVDVIVIKPPQKVVTMNQAATEIMLSLGLQDRMAGTAYLDDEVLPELAAAYASVPVLAKEYPSKEALLAEEPDFVYASYRSAFGDEGVGDRAGLAKLGVGTYLSPAGCAPEFRPERLTIDDVHDEIRDIGRIFGVPDRAEAFVAEQRRRIDTALTAAGPARDTTVFWWDGGSDAPSAGACCGAPAMIMSKVGVRNVFGGVSGSWGDVSWEKVVERDPDVIVLVDAEWSPAAQKRAQLQENPTLKDLPAVANNRFVTIPFSATTVGVRNVLAVEGLAKGIAAIDPRRN